MAKLCQLEFHSTRIEASLAFAEEILGWRKVPVSMQDQIIIEVPEDSPYGISLRSSSAHDRMPSSTLAYFECEAPLAELKLKISELGGKILSGPLSVTGYGLVLVAEDPGGIRYGLYEAKFEGPRPKQS